MGGEVRVDMVDKVNKTVIIINMKLISIIIIVIYHQEGKIQVTIQLYKTTLFDKKES